MRKKITCRDIGSWILGLAALAMASSTVFGQIQTWSGWSEVPGGGTTYAPLCAVAHRGQLYLFEKGDNNQIYWGRYDGSAWRETWTAIPGGGTTDAGLGGATFDGRLY